MQASGAEVIHLGHNRSVARDRRLRHPGGRAGHRHHLLPGRPRRVLQVHDRPAARARRAHIEVFGGGGGTILPSEIEELHAYGVARIYSPDDGRAMGLQGMINDLLQQLRLREARAAELEPLLGAARRARRRRPSAALITVAENYPGGRRRSCARQLAPAAGAGAAAAGARHHRHRRRGQVDPGRRAGAPLPGRLRRTRPSRVISVDPSKRKTGGALLGDRIRMNAIDDPRVYMRSLATRQSNLALSQARRARRSTSAGPPAST